MASFYDQVALLSAEVLPLSENRFQLTYVWMRLSAPPDVPPLLAMTTLEGWDRGRIPHPASLATPLSAWPIGVPIQETLTIEIPPNLPPGPYSLAVNWYNYDDLSRLLEDKPLPDHQPVTTITLEIP